MLCFNNGSPYLINCSILFPEIIIINDKLSEFCKKASVNLFFYSLIDELAYILEMLHVYLVIKLVKYKAKNMQLNIACSFILFWLRFRSRTSSWKYKNVTIWTFIKSWYSVWNGEWLSTPKAILAIYVFKRRDYWFMTLVHDQVRVNLAHLPLFPRIVMTMIIFRYWFAFLFN